MEKAEPFGFVTAEMPPIELNPEIILPEIKIPPMPPVNVKVEAPIVKVEPIIKVEPEHARAWKFVIHKRKDGDIEMTARPL